MHRSSPALSFRARAASLCLIALLSLSGCGGGGNDPAPATTATPAPSTEERGASALAWETSRSMGPGVNFGNMLEAPQEGEWGLRVESAHIDAAWQAGFRTVRLPVRWSNHAAANYPYAVDPAFMARVTSVVDALLGKGFYVVLNLHHHRQLDGDTLDPGEFAVDDNVLEARFVGIWNQIARQLAAKSPKLIFELYNEPHGRLTAAAWNALARATLETVRLSNPTRLVALGPTSHSNASALGTLALPNDRNLMATFHHYAPFDFTHQGAPWVSPALPVGLTCCNAAQLAEIETAFAQASVWSSVSGYPVFLGEFGAYSAADMASRVAYTRAVRQAANARQMPWAYWEFASHFGIYDPATGLFRTELTAALVGP